MTAHDFADLFDVRRAIAGKDLGDISKVARAQQTRLMTIRKRASTSAPFVNP